MERGAARCGCSLKMKKTTFNNFIENLPIINYNIADGKANVTLFARDGSVWMNQNQLAELFDTSKQNIGQHITNILEEKELDENSVVKNSFTTAAQKNGIFPSWMWWLY
jgi:hypothetical protein